MANDAATVQGILVFLQSKLVQYDAKLEARGDRNPYRLAHYLGALQKVEEDVESVKQALLSPTSAITLRTAISAHFVVETARDGSISALPPVKATLKAIDKAMVTGKRPSIV